VAGGLAFSTVVSLLFLPSIYTLLDDANTNLRRIIGRARERAPLRRAYLPEAGSGSTITAVP
jgi:HAE1 family hydrophobic/amphiphilic exporter-1